MNNNNSKKDYTDQDFNNDLVNLLNELENPTKDSEIAYLSQRANRKFMYASLSSCIEVVKKIISKHNFALSQAMVRDEGRALLQTRLIHKSGKWYTDGGVPLIAKNTSDPHQLGSSITYAKRYGLLALLGLDGDDDNDATDVDNIENLKLNQRG
tara:strand:+ start:131 stop:592 length:462 start_codon:yes stop_codon:yes gene_type:complete